MRKIIIVLLICLPGMLFARKRGQARIDSLIPELTRLKEDTNKVLVLNDIGYNYNSINPDEGLKYAQQCMDLALKLNWKKGIAYACNSFGVNYQHKSDYTKSLEYYQQSLKVSEEIEFKYGISTAFQNLGVVYKLLNKYDESLEYYTKALKIFEETGDKESIAKANGGIGSVYRMQGNYGKALEYYFKQLKIDEEVGDKSGIALVTGNIGNIYYFQSDYATAITYYLKQLKIDEEIGEKEGVARVNGNIGGMYVMQKDYSKAIEYLEKGLKQYEELGNKSGIADITSNLSSAYCGQKNYVLAIEYAQRSLKMAGEIGNKHLVAENLCNIGNNLLLLTKDTGTPAGGASGATLAGIPAGKAARLRKATDYLEDGLAKGKEIKALDIMEGAYAGLSDVYRATGDYKKALESADNYRAIKDSVFSKENDEKIVKMAAKNDYDRLRLTDSMKTDAKEKITTLQVQRQRGVIWGSLGVLGLVIVLSFVTYRNYNLQKKANVIIKAEKEKAEEQRERAEQSERFKQQFLTNMSHEIRTPMNAVLGMTHLTLDTPHTPKQNKYLTAVKKSSENLLVIINDVLDLSKLEAGKMELEQIPFLLSDQISQVYDTMQFKAEEKGLVLQTEIAAGVPRVLIGDPSRLNQVLINLCGNAIKFTAKGTVKILVEKVKDTEATLCFKVIDSGIGIPADKIDKLFEAFRQVDASTSRKYGGTGLGLSISKTLVELQGGRVDVKSEDGKGSEFSFTITYGVADEKAIAELNTNNKTNPATLEGIRILVAEDNEYNQVVIKDTLENLIKGVKVDVADNGKIAIDRFLANDYDVIMMDVNMPEMGGIEATQLIRNNPDKGKSKIPIIALTASVLTADLNKCIDAGMNTCVPKPFKRDELLSTLARFYRNENGTSKENYSEADQEQPTVQEHPANSVTDLTFLTDFCEGDKSRMKKYIDIYLKVTPGNLARISAAFEAHDLITLSQGVHAMKAHLNYMGMKQTREIAEKAELYAIEQENREQLPLLIAKLQSDWERSRDELNLFN